MLTKSEFHHLKHNERCMDWFYSKTQKTEMLDKMPHCVANVEKPIPCIVSRLQVQL